MTKIDRILKSVPMWLWLILFTVIPLLMILFYSVVDVSGGEFRFTTEYIGSVVSNPDYMRTTLISIEYAAISTLVCLLLGYPLCCVLVKLKPKFRGIVVLLFMLPMWMNFLIRTYAMRSLMDEGSLITKLLVYMGWSGTALSGTDAAVIIGMVYNFLPFLILPIYTSMLKIDNRLIEAAQDLGANNVKVFTKITFPMTLPGVISGVTMVFVPCITTFIIPQMLGGNMVWTIGSLIEYKFRNEAGEAIVSNEGAALSFLLMIIVMLCMAAVNKFDKDNQSVI